MNKKNNHHMKIQFKKVGLTQEIINRMGEILAVSLTVEEQNINIQANSNTVMIDYDNMTNENKKIVDDFINLLKNS